MPAIDNKPASQAQCGSALLPRDKNTNVAAIAAYGNTNHSTKNMKAPALLGLSTVTNQTVAHAAMPITINAIGNIHFRRGDLSCIVINV